ncbi:TolC family outer membrane protein [Croceicoccus sp. F390]|uniref:TolC family outer membrane protein n=1 Tax=Croceicoccus esteveae TaxID=3075597 RepID=A0ABU2ZIM2_9SPHN|nr:TolC family outer membrane protein [Croceicoccus sp. F390]MDT0576154.1 TolC family outer membrane protein [Croceicoccus sp. F390]
MLLLTGTICAAALVAPAGEGRADTLQEALALAYQSNPTIETARADLRAADANVAINRADALPDVRANVTYTEFVKQSTNSFTAPDRGLFAGLDLAVPVYQGGAVRNSIRAAQERVLAGRADLRGTESGVFSQVVAAYMDVIRDAAVVRLSRQNVEALGVNLQATSDRFEIGDLTRTDVAQSGSRLALAQSDLLTAQSNLISSRERYIQLVGKEPTDLEPPPPLPNLPDSPEQAVDVALRSNPDLIAAQERSEAARYDIKVAGSGRYPRVELYTSGGYNDYFGTLGGGQADFVSQAETTAQAGARLSIPIFQGGRPAALQRQAQARASATLELAVAVERDVIAQVRASYAAWIAALQVIDATTTGVDAASLSLEGVRAENTVGNRTILDILDAERELLTAQVQLVTARRNAYVAGFSLLAAMGRAEAEDLALEVGPLYDPVANYEANTRFLWDWSMDPDPVAQSSRTVDTRAQDARIADEPVFDAQ